MIVEFNKDIDRIHCAIENNKIHFLLIKVHKNGSYQIMREFITEETINFVKKWK